MSENTKSWFPASFKNKVGVLVLTGKDDRDGGTAITRSNWQEWSVELEDTWDIVKTSKTSITVKKDDKTIVLKRSKSKDNTDGTIYTAIINGKTHFAEYDPEHTSYN